MSIAMCRSERILGEAEGPGFPRAHVAQHSGHGPAAAGQDRTDQEELNFVPRRANISILIAITIDLFLYPHKD